MIQQATWRGAAIGVACVCAAAMVAAGMAAPPQMTIVAGGGVAGFTDGAGAEARFNKPIRLAPFGPDAVLVADIYNHAIRSVSKDGRVRTIAGRPDRKGHEDGPAATARFASPHGVATAPGGLIAVAEAEGHALRLLTPKTGAAGGYEVSTLAGTAGKSGGADGPARQALFNSPHAALWGGDGASIHPTSATPQFGASATVWSKPWQARAATRWSTR